MPIETEKVGDPAGRKSAATFGEDVMKNSATEDLIKAIDKLSDDKKQQVAEFIKGLTAMVPSTNQAERRLSSAELAALEEESELLSEMAKDMQPFNVLELMEDLRR